MTVVKRSVVSHSPSALMAAYRQASVARIARVPPPDRPATTNTARSHPQRMPLHAWERRKYRPYPLSPSRGKLPGAFSKSTWTRV